MCLVDAPKIPLDKAWIASEAARLQTPYHIHHARGDTIRMLLWMDDNEPCRVPPYNTHQVAVGGLVITDDKKVLAIKEKQAVVSGFKLPGGRADPGEHFGEAVVREVFEETGVRCRFHSLVALRHMHGFRHGQSDLYFICRCVPETLDIVMCERELGAACWMSLEDYIADTMPLNQVFMKSIKHSIDAAGGKHNQQLLDIDLPEIIMPSPYSPYRKKQQDMHFYHLQHPQFRLQQQPQ